MHSREREARLLERCVCIAAGKPGTPLDEREANAVRVAAMLVLPRHPAAAARLRNAADDHFAHHRRGPHRAGELIRRGWLSALPRFRAMLDSRLAAP